MAELFLTGSNVLANPNVSTNSSGGNAGQGTMTITGGSTPFEPDDFLVFSTQSETVQGELGGSSAFNGLVVYETYEDYLNGIPKYTYAPQNPGQTATIQSDVSGLGDSYVRFNANVLVSSDVGAPAISTLLLTPTVDWSVTDPSSGVVLNHYTDHDFNESGSIESGTTEPANGLYSVSDWNSEVLSAQRDYVVSGTSGNDLINSAYTGDPHGDQIDSADAQDGSNDDVVEAGGGNDTVLAGEGDDTVYGGAGDDSLFGGEGDDLLDGGEGDDVLTGGLGNDTFVAGSGHDTITDFGDDLGDPDDDDASNNDFIDLSGYYNQANYDAAVAAGDIDPAVTRNPLEWMRADLEDDGVLNDTAAGWSATDSLTLLNGGVTVDSTDLTLETTNVVCFAAGTLIKTSKGEIPVEELSVGTPVLTMDASLQKVRWIGSRHLTQAALAGNPNLRPIRISAGALGANMPEHDLVVSPQHRILINSIIAERMFGEREVLVAAKKLLDCPGVEVDQAATEVTYWHFLLENHEIVFSNGMPTESLFTGPEALRSVDPSAREEILTIFPELAEVDHAALPRSARRIVKGRAIRQLVARVMKNRKELFQDRH